MSIKNVSFVGLGVMGYPMAGHLKKNGYNVTVFNRTESKAKKWVEEHGGHMGKTPKQAATAKKGRLNILRIYRRNKKVGECNKITKDMRYIDKKYKLGTSKNICGKSNQAKKTRKKRKSIKSRKSKK